MINTDTLADRHLSNLRARWEAAGRGPPADRGTLEFDI